MTSKLQPTNPLSGPGDIEALPFRSIISDEFQHDTPGFVRAFAGKVWMVQGIPTKVVWPKYGNIALGQNLSWFLLMYEGNGTGKANGTK